MVRQVTVRRLQSPRPPKHHLQQHHLFLPLQHHLQCMGSLASHTEDGLWCPQRMAPLLNVAIDVDIRTDVGVIFYLDRAFCDSIVQYFDSLLSWMSQIIKIWKKKYPHNVWHKNMDRMINFGLHTHPKNWSPPPFTLKPRPRGAKTTSAFLYTPHKRI